jgi:hypothetical protein
LDDLWTELGRADGSNTFAILHRLAEDPASVLPFLNDRLRPVPKVHPARIRQWVVDLDDERFKTRETAMRELARLADVAEPVLREAARTKGSLEFHLRVDLLRKRLGVDPDLVRADRAILILEWIGTREARRLLETLTTGAPEAHLTQEARQALRRLELSRR